MSAETELLTVEEMYRADALTIEGGVSGAELMEKAGVRVVALITAKWERGRVLILCGPGNNGGDGYVAARLLKEAGWQVDLVAIGDPKMLKGDAAVMRDRWGGAIDTPAAADPEQANLVIDAVFGAGLTRALEEPVVSLFRKVREAGLPVIAVDMPSGVNGNDGTADAATLSASYTVTFFRGKPGHFLYPGRGFCGELLITDIGIEAGVLRKIAPKTSRNDPALWRDLMPRADALGHKYSRGHAAVTGGGVASTGAARLSARAALRSGAGAVTLITPFSALMVYASALTAVMVRACGEPSDFAAWIREKRIGVVLLGPGNGVSDRTRGFVEAALESNADVLLDADALTVFKDEPETLFSLIVAKRMKKRGGVILTPHEAEFARIFSCEGSKLERARAAAEKSGAVVLLKGADTVIAAPDGRAVINHNAPPVLATAGSGDVLAGIITGLVAGGMPLFEAATAGAWLHGAAGLRIGPGLIAEDIEACLPALLRHVGEEGKNM